MDESYGCQPLLGWALQSEREDVENERRRAAEEERGEGLGGITGTEGCPCLQGVVALTGS